MNPSELIKYRQNLPLDLKIELSKKRIREWYHHWDGEVYVAFSGGKDSTVLLHMVRSLFPDVPAVFVDTGLEYPEIREFVKTIDNVEWLKPKKNFKKVLEDYGYPVVSKMISMAISRYRNTNDPVQKLLRLHGGVNPTSGKKQTTGVISKKWRYLTNAPFKISEQCCEVMKKSPFRRYFKKHGRHPFIGLMASDSHYRKLDAHRGCNLFDEKTKSSRPMLFWNEEDIWEYIKKYKVNYSKIYDMGYDRTGCMFCCFGLHMESSPNRFQLMQETHPKQWKFAITVLGLGKVLDYMKIPYTINSFYTSGFFTKRLKRNKGAKRK